MKTCALGLGLAALGRPAYLVLGHGEDLRGQAGVESMKERTHAVLDAAWTAGIRYFDAARSYGFSEQFLSGWLEARVPVDVVVAACSRTGRWGGRSNRTE